MSNIANAFKNGKAFIPFFTCGFPDMETSKAAIKAAADNGHCSRMPSTQA